jgi:hypothetical protein
VKRGKEIDKRLGNLESYLSNLHPHDEWLSYRNGIVP